MNLEQLRARLAEIKANIDGIAAGADGYTQEQLDQIETLSADYDKVSGQIEAQLKVEKMKAAAPSAGRQATNTPAPVTTPRVEGMRDVKEKYGGFENAGAFFMSVRRSYTTGHTDSRLNGAGTMQERVGEDGGFLVPEDVSSEIQKVLDDPQESFLAKTRSFKVSGNSLSLPIDENTPWTQGVQAKWVGEGDQIDTAKNQLGMASWKLKKLAIIVPVTEELLEDSTALESYIKSSTPAAFVAAVNDAIISGAGVGKPKGILQSGMLITQAKESMQTADTINATNIINMYSRLLPKSIRNAAWFINAGAVSQLMKMKDDNGNYIYLAPGSQMNNNPYAMLMGLPVISMMSAMPALGDLGDILLADLSMYYTIVKAAGIKQSMSSHVYFDRDKVAFKFTFRIDGSVPFTKPVSAQYGSHTASAFVALEAR